MDLIDCNFLWNLTWFLDKLWEVRKMDGQDFSVEVNPAAQSPHGCWTFSRIQYFFSLFFSTFIVCNPAQANLLWSCWYFDSWSAQNWVEREGNIAGQKGDCSELLLAWGPTAVAEPWRQIDDEIEGFKTELCWSWHKTIAGQIEILYFVVLWENCRNKKKGVANVNLTFRFCFLVFFALCSWRYLDNPPYLQQSFSHSTV